MVLEDRREEPRDPRSEDGRIYASAPVPVHHQNLLICCTLIIVTWIRIPWKGCLPPPKQRGRSPRSA